MAEPAGSKPDTTIEQASEAGVKPQDSYRHAEQARESYHEEGKGADPGGRRLGREDPTTDGVTAPDKDNVQIR